jgi:hypothetical protein
MTKGQMRRVRVWRARVEVRKEDKEKGGEETKEEKGVEVRETGRDKERKKE